MNRYFFIGIPIGAVALFFGWTSFCKTVFDFDFGDDRSDFTPTQNYSSPNGKYTAQTYIESGGGAAGWCFNCVCINANPYFPYSDEYDVFRIVPAQTELNLEWINSNTLKISYEITEWTSTFRNQSQKIKDVTVLFNPICKE